MMKEFQYLIGLVLFTIVMSFTEKHKITERDFFENINDKISVFRCHTTISATIWSITTYVWVDKKSVIKNNKTYYPIILHTAYSDKNENPLVTKKDIHGYLRKEGSKIFFLHKPNKYSSDSSEYLFIDFNAVPGDKWTLFGVDYRAYNVTYAYNYYIFDKEGRIKDKIYKFNLKYPFEHSLPTPTLLGLEVSEKNGFIKFETALQNPTELSPKCTSELVTKIDIK